MAHNQGSGFYSNVLDFPATDGSALYRGMDHCEWMRVPSVVSKMKLGVRARVCVCIYKLTAIDSWLDTTDDRGNEAEWHI